MDSFFDSTKHDKLNTQKLWLRVKNYRLGRLKHKEIGCATVSVESQLLDGHQHEKWYDLVNEGHKVGQICVRFRFSDGTQSDPFSRLEAYEIGDLIGE